MTDTNGNGGGAPHTLTITAAAQTAIPEASSTAYLGLGGLVLCGVLGRAIRRSKRLT